MGDQLLRFAGFELDQQRAELRSADGVAIKLRPKTFEMLRLFATSGGRVLSKQELMEAVWPNVHVGEDSLFQCIRELRTALGDERRQLIKLASGGGYLLAAEVVAAPEVTAQAEASRAAPIAEVATALPTEVAAVSVKSQRTVFGLSRQAMVAAVAGLCVIVVGLAVAAPVLKPDLLFRRTPPRLAVMLIVDASNDSRGAVLAAEVTGRLTDGFAKIQNISVVAPRLAAAAGGESMAAPAASSDYELRGELQFADQSWTLRTRIIKAGSGEVQAVAAMSISADEQDAQPVQSRLAAGVGHVLARRLNEILEPSTSSARRTASAGGDRVAVEQALASINQTTRERFGAAQAMLQKALSDDPENLDIAVALASLQMRGIQMVWFSPEEAAAVEARANATLEQALRAKPNSIAVLEATCRFLSATNHFVESLVTCAKALNFDPWNGSALYLIGLGQVYLGRFEDALATFRLADRFDAPPASRWTWLLGAGMTYVLMGRYEEALPWLQRSIAITPGTGRSHFMLAAAYQRSGRFEEARAAIAEGLRLRPGTTRLSVWPPMKNASPVCIAAWERVVQAEVDAGLPEQ
ncbi:DNA-binding winged helix-turn-helix (wHTH) protein/tetratricopeptide (TPR) repeat protein [Bradyrhizobium elkanii]|uniref:Transcriptional regulator CadC n=1 Tax=Bradyrhizobium japonicum TaxID=375 RepID=A0A1L3FI24_BRAJP|nr:MULTISPECIES: tetratricopeptide repeat protein [Bradyrhizobium]APG12852.1 transcriptional regulator CadC [Bradyrhizobium japonicum]MCS3930995.1 DNA-binding winged helix-turn-helix (wHTH) protein/tetratricopeptide (TPR) repeat protein [Bradyrhizobium elkanii]MCS3971553.1 DNA-binding winged helix-turn-helix (wHTH) protein/tetratricopeptide (TPR) repeat protein [Bradyrhizobium japonicum]